MFDQALQYHALKFSLIPVIGKNAAVKWGKYQRRRPTEKQIQSWFGNGHDYTGVALISGCVSNGLAIRDFDDRAVQSRWQNQHPDLASSLPTVQTKRGAHYYCRAAQGSLEAVRRLLGCEGIGAIEVEGGELRADVGCYVLAPPSIHPAGGKYEWVRPLRDELPEVDLRQFLSPGELTHREHRTCHESSVSTARSMNSMSSVSSMSAVSSVCQTAAEAITTTLPSEPGYRHRLVFNFARHLKAIPSLANADVRALKPYVQEWHSRALPFIATKSFEETWLDFVEGWRKVKYAAGEEPVAMVYQASLEKALPAAADQYETIELRRLVALCRELQRAAGSNPFYLAGRTAAELLGVPHTQAARWLRLLILDDVLELIAAGTRHKAAEYRYLGDRVAARTTGTNRELEA